MIAPQDLIRLVGYLEAVTHGLSIDLVTVTSYKVGDRTFVVPQREDPDRPVRAEPTGTAESALVTRKVPGFEAFAERVATAPAIHRPTLDLFMQWAQRVSDGGLANVHTYFGKNEETVLLPYVPGEGVGLASLYMRADGRPALQWWRSVFERRAPGSITGVENAGGALIGKGSIAPAPDQMLLDATYAAYVEASGSAP